MARLCGCSQARTALHVAGIKPAGAANMPLQSCALCHSGTYSGAGNIGVNFNNRPITVQGIAGAAVTLFDTQGTGPAFRFVSGETSTSILKGNSWPAWTRSRRACTGLAVASVRGTCAGVTIWNSLLMTLGAAAAYSGNGGGLYISTSSPDIQDCTFTLLAVCAQDCHGKQCAAAGPAPVQSLACTAGYRKRWRRVCHGHTRQWLAASVLLPLQCSGHLRVVHADSGAPCGLCTICAVDEPERAPDL